MPLPTEWQAAPALAVLAQQQGSVSRTWCRVLNLTCSLDFPKYPATYNPPGTTLLYCSSIADLLPSSGISFLSLDFPTFVAATPLPTTTSHHSQAHNASPRPPSPRPQAGPHRPPILLRYLAPHSRQAPCPPLHSRPCNRLLPLRTTSNSTISLPLLPKHEREASAYTTRRAKSRTTGQGQEQGHLPGRSIGYVVDRDGPQEAEAGRCAALEGCGNVPWKKACHAPSCAWSED